MGSPQAVITIETSTRQALENLPLSEILEVVRLIVGLTPGGADVFLSYDEADD